MSQRSATHATFVIERTFEASPSRVFKAFSDPKAKAVWFSGPEDWEPAVGELDFRVGGRETNKGGPKGGFVTYLDGRYMDIIPNERIIFAYEMQLDGKRISVSVSTIEFIPVGAKTKLKFTEQGVFLDGFDDPSLRERGTIEAIETLGRALASGKI